MQDTNDTKEPDRQHVDRIVARATASARAKNDRLRRLKERNELYLANKRAELGLDDDDDLDDEVTREL
jgi:hypothetical protein